MTRRRRQTRAAARPVELTPTLREAFRLVPARWAFLGGRAWICDTHTTLSCRFRNDDGLPVRATVRIGWDGDTRESLTFSARLR